MKVGQNEFNVGKEEDFDLKKFVANLVSNWPYYIISIILCSCLAFAYARYGTPGYKISSKVTIDEDPSSGLMGKSSSSLVDFSDILSMPSNAYNEMEILNSRALMTKVVTKMHLDVTIARKGYINSIELFDESPFNVQVINKVDTIEGRHYSVKVIDGNSIHVTGGKENVDAVVKFGAALDLPQFKLIFTPIPGKQISKYGYRVSVTSIDDRVEQLSKNLTVDLTDKKSTTMLLSFKYPNPKKGEVILDNLMALYIDDNHAHKVQIADSTLDFINSRINVVNKELTGVETNFEKFKRQK